MNQLKREIIVLVRYKTFAHSQKIQSYCLREEHIPSILDMKEGMTCFNRGANHAKIRKRTLSFFDTNIQAFLL